VFAKEVLIFLLKDINLVILIGFIISFPLWLIIFELKDSSQILTNVLLPFLNICIFLFFVKLLFSNLLWNKYLAIFLAVLQCSTFAFYHYNRSFIFDLKYVDNRMYEMNLSRAVYLTTKLDYLNYMDRNPEYRIPSPEIRRYSRGYSPICITTNVIPKAKDFSESYYSDYMIKISPFSQFCKFNNSESSQHIRQLMFIKKHRIRNIYFSRTFDNVDFFIDKLNLKFVCSDNKRKYDLYTIDLTKKGD
jgi:hypothetical protein